ncbi:hypothetical protein [Streptomyces sp. ISL-94]|uniref:hypothetical protein n=1 Tax=Streptomyces sp. ISL-94 TaxID=2819190 RepID=UPI001BE68C91|nr:hypothetical protein [Streptomyces sp. ISL-94]MBT2481991.1 hypothetical protein [Streptomyces sp. ISL-94]
MAGRTGRRPGAVSAPYQVGDVVRGPEALPPGDYRTPATYEGKVVQVGSGSGSGWSGVDADSAYLWVRLPDSTERKLAIRACVLLTPANRPAP